MSSDTEMSSAPVSVTENVESAEDSEQSSDVLISKPAATHALKVTLPTEPHLADNSVPLVASHEEEGHNEVHCAAVSVATASKMPDAVMEDASKSVTGGGGGDDGSVVCVTEAVAETTSGDEGSSVSYSKEAGIPVSVAKIEDSSVSIGRLPGAVPEHTELVEELSLKPERTGSVSHHGSTSKSIYESEQHAEYSLQEVPPSASAVRVTMATVNPAPPTTLSASPDSCSSNDAQKMAVSGALAMLAGYNSDDDVDSDAEESVVAVAGPELTVDREGLYRDSLAAPWSGDSESDSDSSEDSSDSSSSSSDSEPEPAAEVDDKDDDGETDQVRGVFGPMTKGELCLLDLPPIEHLHIALPEDQCTKVGVVASVVDCLVVVQSTPGSPPLDIDSVLFLERGRRPLGRVYDVMGPVSEAAYCVRFNTPQEIEEFGIKAGAEVFFAPGSAEYSHFVFVEALRKMRGSDASWWDSNEPPENCLDFSDDEEERNHKRQSRKRPVNDQSASSESTADGRDVTAVRPRPPRPRPERGRGGRPPWMPSPPRNPFYTPPGQSAAPPLRWQQAPPPGPFRLPPPPPPPPPPPGDFSQPPPPPPGGFGQPPPPFTGLPPTGLPPGGPPTNHPPPGLPPGGSLPNQPPPWSQPAFWGGR